MRNTTIIYRSPSEIDSLIHAFQEGSLPRSQWTHEAHLTVALWYLFYDSEQEAINAVRNGIKRYTISLKVCYNNNEILRTFA
jgi:hypothetical protein